MCSSSSKIREINSEGRKSGGMFSLASRGVSWRAVLDCPVAGGFSRAENSSGVIKGVDEISEFRQYFLARVMRTLVSSRPTHQRVYANVNTPKELMLASAQDLCNRRNVE